MKALSLTQPRATIVAIRAKRIEPRSWATSYRGPLAIHAAKGLGPVGGKRGLHDLCWSGHFKRVLFEEQGYFDADRLPLGAIVAVCDLAGCVPVESVEDGFFSGSRPPEGVWLWELTDQERAFGDYSPGRYAWLLANIRELLEPVPCGGARRLWEPDTLTQRAVQRQLIAGVGV